MNIYADSRNEKMWETLATLKTITDKAKRTALKIRITKQPHITDLEYLLGAFIEMYEPHLEEIVYKLTEKGYAVDAISGFGGKNSEFQIMSGDFSVDYITKNKLEKIGVKFREYNGSQSLIFWPEKARIEDIKDKWMQIIDILPDHGTLAVPSSSRDAICFRRKYIPQDTSLQKQRLFERLKYSIQRKTKNESKIRKEKNPHPNKIELTLGLFIEEIEPQLRHAIIELNRKGYSTDASGFMDNPRDQMIEGDFRLDEKTVDKLKEAGAAVETNPSGYTKLQFSPIEPDISKIKNKWNQIASLLPDKHQSASPSMTRKARDFRIKYQ